VKQPVKNNMAKVTVREARFDEKDLAGILTVLRQVLAVPYSACSFIDFVRMFNHKWLDNPARTRDHVFGWVVDSPTDGIVGFVGQVPVRIKIGEREIVGACGSSYGVLPAYRGYSLMLYKQLIDWGDKHFLVFTTANRMSSKINETMGLNKTPISDISRKLLWLLRPEVGVNWALRESKRKVWHRLTEQFPGAYLLKGVARVWFVRHRRLKIKCPKLAVEPVVSFTKEFDDLWENNKKDYAITTVRDQAFLTWRHLRVTNVIGRTFVFACRDNGQMRGYIALQARSHESGYLRGHYVVTDLFYERTRKDVLYNLMNHAFEFAKTHGCSIFEASDYSNEVAEELTTQRPYVRSDESCSYWYKGLTNITADLNDDKAWWPSGADGDSNL